MTTVDHRDDYNEHRPVHTNAGHRVDLEALTFTF